jgi:hypothetical protein
MQKYRFVVREEPQLVGPDVTEKELIKAVPKLRIYMEARLQPLYQFVGAIAAAANDMNEKRYYKFKSGVHSERTVNSDADLRIKHPFIPKRIIDMALEIRAPPEEPKLEPDPVVKPEPTEDSEAQIRFQLIGPFVRENGQLRWEPTSDVYSFILSNPLHGIVASTCDDLNRTLGVNWTTALLIDSPDTRFKFANMVATRLIEGRAEVQPRRGHGRPTYFISHTYLHTSAQSKLLMGAKRWFADVVLTRPPQAQIDELRAIIDNDNAPMEALFNAQAQLEQIQGGTLRYVGTPLLRVKTRVI